MTVVVGDGTWLTVGEAAEVLNVHPDTVRRAVTSGQLKAGRTPGGHRRITRASVEEFRRKLYGDAGEPSE